MMGRIVFSLGTVLGIGCMSDATDSGVAAKHPCEPGAGPSAILGVGELAYESVEDCGGMAELIHGPQGGYHINMALQAEYLDASAPWFVHLIGEIDGEVVGETKPYATMRCNQSVPALQAWALLLIWDAEPEDLHGKTAAVTAELEDASGTTLNLSADVVIYDPYLE